jgi:hypothetical protein
LNYQVNKQVDAMQNRDEQNWWYAKEANHLDDNKAHMPKK